ncbi:MAG TPA: hypothetical protein VHA52_05180, partial [Candidatus Babeliaceae bacterium]|nr:hypothetical protein [Candidatus Babeliaceae bacterium]
DILSVVMSLPIPSDFRYEITTAETKKVRIGALNSTKTNILLRITRPDTLESTSDQSLLDCGATDCFIDRNYV